MDELHTNTGNRIKKPTSPELINTAFSLECGDSDVLFDGISKADIAHVVMLLEEGIIPLKPGKRLLAELLDLDKRNPADLQFEPRFGDTYTNRERLLKERIGADAGWLHTGRARRESSTIGFILAVRRRLLNFGVSLSNTLDALTDQAGWNIDTVMSDFTYLHHAQPTSLGHYLLTFAFPLLRDMERTRETYTRVNSSPAGCGSTNGSALPLNRERLAELLGFNGNLTVHARDAMWRTDIPIETYSVLVNACININRLVEEMQIWTTSEFNMVELDDAHCRTSVIMPQKKNPYGLTYFRGLTGLLIGKANGMSTILKAVSGQPDNRIFAYGELPRAIDLCADGFNLIGSIIGGMKVNKEVLYQQAAMQFSAATDLAEVLMVENQLDYASCHRIVGAAVRLAMEQGQDRFTREIVMQAAQLCDTPLSISEEAFDRVLKPESIVDSRIGVGGAAKQRVEEMLDECNKGAAEFRAWLEAQKQDVMMHEVSLIEVASSIVEKA
jgi:argininosuccinate lyase